MWGRLRSNKEKDQDFGCDWLLGFEKETKDYYSKNPEKISEFYTRNKGKNMK
ncbi:hypothetical protein [Methanoplanus limicola]|uniref:Uncharacterized protein n=1 Tax=Methanoplanus limicola DSM 2279 TaxID=937775 RepID=H1YXA0_9EURY|nr:hypothetical protein [Methanoplanus limicola]EHQ35903.1 hypothetical protein Metlim_1802 [Methanoplanus limicola DSM 2279]